MGQKILVTESQLKDIIKKMISEQSQGYDYTSPYNPNPYKSQSPSSPTPAQPPLSRNQTTKTPVSKATPEEYKSVVARVQQQLAALGFLKSKPTGYYGPLTKAAVIAFQQSKGIKPVDGYFIKGRDNVALDNINMGNVQRLFYQPPVQQSKPVPPKPVAQPRDNSKIAPIAPRQSTGVKERPAYWGGGSSDTSIQQRQSR